MTGFRGFFLLSLFLHVAAGGAAAVLLRWGTLAREEMVIDLTGSFRTSEAARVKRRARLEPGPAAGPLSAAAVPEELDDFDFEETDPSIPFYELTSLPRLEDRDMLREKLSRYYPQEAKYRGVEGVVMLEVVVSSRGRIVEAKVLDSSPPLFAAAALKVCSELVFVPAYLRTRTVAVRLKLPIRFELEE